jgi:hypothetical protein
VRLPPTLTDRPDAPALDAHRYEAGL